MIEERSLILSVKAGSEKAYHTLYDMWVSRLYRFVYQYLKSEDATDDVVQETFCRIWTNREKLDPDSSFKAYLFTIAYHFLIKGTPQAVEQRFDGRICGIPIHKGIRRRCGQRNRFRPVLSGAPESQKQLISTSA